MQVAASSGQEQSTTQMQTVRVTGAGAGGKANQQLRRRLPAHECQAQN
jgi:hypothetical protein